MAKPDTPPGLDKTFTVTHPTDPTSPKEVTQQQWKDDKMGQAGWVKEEEETTDPNAPVINPLKK